MTAFIRGYSSVLHHKKALAVSCWATPCHFKFNSYLHTGCLHLCVCMCSGAADPNQVSWANHCDDRGAPCHTKPLWAEILWHRLAMHQTFYLYYQCSWHLPGQLPTYLFVPAFVFFFFFSRFTLTEKHLSHLAKTGAIWMRDHFWAEQRPGTENTVCFWPSSGGGEPRMLGSALK